MIEEYYYKAVRARLRHPVTLDALDYLWQLPEASPVRRSLCVAGHIHGEEKRRGLYQSPVLSHILRVYSLVAGVSDDPLLHQVALLHDAIEDYRAPDVALGRIEKAAARQEASALLAQHITPDALALVEQLTNPLSYGSLSKQEWQAAHMPTLPLGARIIKIADQFANAISIVEEPEPDRDRMSRQLIKNHAVVQSCLQDLESYLTSHPEQRPLLPPLQQLHGLFMRLYREIEAIMGPDLMLPAHCAQAQTGCGIMDVHLTELHSRYPWSSSSLALAA